MQPVLEIYPPDDFALRPVAEIESFSYLPLSGELAPAEVGTAVMRIAGYNDIDPEESKEAPTRTTVGGCPCRLRRT